MDDDLFPHPASVGVLYEVDLVENDHRKPIKRRVSCIDHVSEDFSRHDHDGGVGVDGDVSRQEPDLLLAVFATPVAILLVRQCLNRRRIDRASLRC